MRHPLESQLALYAGGDLSLLQRVRTASHLRGCLACRASVDSYRNTREQLQTACAELPQGLDWNRLAAEMTGNIRVGLAAGECVASAPAPAITFGWKPAFAAAGLTAMVLCGWWLNFPIEQRDALTSRVKQLWNRDHLPLDTGVYLEANRAGIQFKENGASLILTHPSATTPAVISVSTQGSMRARYIDTETAQITITNVYAQ